MPIPLELYLKTVLPLRCNTAKSMSSATSSAQRGPQQLEVVEYKVGQEGYRDVAQYDQARYAGPANEYKQRVMGEAYRRLIGPLEGKRILDVGCGTGRGVVEFSRRAAYAAGSDASLDMLRFAKQKVTDAAGVGLAAAHAQRLPFADASFDIATSLNFLHLFSLEELGVEPARVDRFETADGRVLERPVGFAMLYAGGRSTATAVVFAQPGDMILLGAHGLEGLNLRVDLMRKALVPAGPVPAAVA